MATAITVSVCRIIMSAGKREQFSTFLMADDPYNWERVYEDDDLIIDMDTSKVTVDPSHIGRVTFRWMWSEPHPLKLTPGISYKSRIEVTEIDCLRKRFHTAEVKLFNAQGKPINFDRFVPYSKWDNVKPGRIMGGIFQHACDLIACRRK